jgi:hypothetical protein
MFWPHRQYGKIGAAGSRDPQVDRDFASVARSIGAPTAIIGAVLDALRPLGVIDIEMPLTAERVWKAIRTAAYSERV